MEPMFIDLKPGTQHADLYIHNMDYVISELMSDNVKKGITDFITKETNADRILFSDNAIMITDAALYENGLFLRVEQVRPWRTTYDNATCEIIITKSFITYAMLKVDDGRYNLSDLEHDSDYSIYVSAYKKSIKALGNRIIIEPREKVYNDEIEKNNFKGPFKKSKRDAVGARLFLEYKDYRKKIETYLQFLPAPKSKEAAEKVKRKKDKMTL